MAIIGPRILSFEEEVNALLANENALLKLSLAQVQDLSFSMRKSNTGIKYSKLLKSLNESQCQALTEAFNKLSTRVIAEWSETQPLYKDNAGTKKLASVYHRAPHGAEMRKDAELFLQQTVESLFPEKPHQQLYIDMAKAAHAIHDVIQEFAPPQNEIKSHLVFLQHCDAIFEKLVTKNIFTQDQSHQLYNASVSFGWETIVVGTIFDFTTKMPLVDVLNRKSVKDESACPKQADPAVASASFAAGKNDTRRMEVTLKSYLTDPELKIYIESQFAATRGMNNLFMAYCRDRIFSPEDLIAFRHMIGQNCRMICELKTHFAKDKDDEHFADFFTKLILDASKVFDDDQRERLKEHFTPLRDHTLKRYFDKLIASFEGDYGEIAFAKGLNAEIFKEALDNFNALYPKHAFGIPGNVRMWGKYAEVLESFIAHIKKQASKDGMVMDKGFVIQVFIDLALYGGHQMGASLLRADSVLAEEYALVVKRCQERAQSMFTRPLPSDPQRLAELLAVQRIPSQQYDPAKFKLPNGVAFTRGKQGIPREEKVKGLEQLVQASKDAELLALQKRNEQEAKKKEDTKKYGKK